MKTRITLDQRLRDVLTATDVDVTTGHIYYQPPSGHRICYPAVVYKLLTQRPIYADNSLYGVWDNYEIQVICEKVDHPLVRAISEAFDLPISNMYVSNRLYHYIFNLNW